MNLQIKNVPKVQKLAPNSSGPIKGRSKLACPPNVLKSRHLSYRCPPNVPHLEIQKGGLHLFPDKKFLKINTSAF